MHETFCKARLPRPGPRGNQYGGWRVELGTDRRSRKAVSRNINGFLNTGKGGTIYLGIIDEGKVKGLLLTQYQRDHVRIAVKDALSRYTPPVPEERYKVDIVPVIDPEEKIEESTAFIDLQDNGCSEVDSTRLRPHILRTSDYCWCDSHAVKQFSEGFLSSLYVVEIIVFPWKKQQLKIEKGRIEFDLHPVYEDEEGNCHFRRQASLVQYSVQEVVELTKAEIKNHFMPLLLSLKEEIKTIGEQHKLNGRH
ncbi:uncharacterized protein LOC111330968 [Stylophora pistillata]|uniref:uncharacterized protein LOC111330968 n=1 Tax=Stylophora pistillata TaxID=50429 RepID=UPI000C0501D8|nr:uncharacterized protein LOC111330968 [Stylophora pistillata]